MANEKDIDMKELEFDMLDDVAGGIEISGDLAEVNTLKSPFLDGLMVKYGVSSYREAMRRMTKEEQFQYIQERKKAKGFN